LWRWKGRMQFEESGRNVHGGMVRCAQGFNHLDVG
jgi:hypothetical protein